MWSPQVTIYYAAPVVVTTVGIYLLYRATQLEGSASDRAFLIGMVLVLSSWGFTAARSTKLRSAVVQNLEGQNHALCIRIRELERQHEELRQDVHSKIAVKQWMEAMDRSESHHSTSWVHLPKDD
jgi:hypothetical protein